MYRIVLLFLFFCSCVQAYAAPLYPLKAGADHRYLVDQQNQPVFLVADAGWTPIHL